MSLTAPERETVITFSDDGVYRLQELAHGGEP